MEYSTGRNEYESILGPSGTRSRLHQAPLLGIFPRAESLL
jgi:hypothetical protein